jgi:3-hydroxyacyl-CoA dehydrogenase
MPVNYELRGDVAVLTLDRPPLNSFDWELRRELLAGVEHALADASVAAIVITGGTGAFSAGADIKEFAQGYAGDMMKRPALTEVVATIEAARKPIVAAIAGPCMGGGLEVALACHYRVASGDARLALPEIRLGLIPGAGGTQRLPRAVGAEAALKMIISGETITGESAVKLGIAESANGDLVSAAVERARRAVRGAGPHRLSEQKAALPTGTTAREFFDGQRRALRNGLPAPGRCIDAVQAAVEEPFAVGIGKEAAWFHELIETPESKALQYAFFSDRRAATVDDLPAGTRPGRIAAVGVVGAGTMGVGIAMCAIEAGLPAILLDRNPELTARGIARVRSLYESQLRKGRIDPPTLERRLSLLRPEQHYGALADVDLVIEAVFEDLAVKEAVFRELDAVLKPGAMLASNTSTLDLDHIAAVTGRPGHVIGLHFFSPANVMRLLEIVRGRETAPAVLATAMSFAKAIGKVGVVARVCDGFIGNRMIEEYLRQAYFMLDEGAMPWDVDSALEQWGMAMGPFAVMDLAGGDIGWAIRKRRAIEQPDRPYSTLPDRLCELGRFGQKTGAGWYRYNPETRARQPDAVVEQLVREHAQSLGRIRNIPAGEMVDRCVLALVNEGAKLLAERIAQRGSDIDVVYRNGYGFPAHRGGPMYHADHLGLTNVLSRMRVFGQGYEGRFWEPAALLSEHAARRTPLASA